MEKVLKIFGAALLVISLVIACGFGMMYPGELFYTKIKTSLSNDDKENIKEFTGNTLDKAQESTDNTIKSLKAWIEEKE